MFSLPYDPFIFLEGAGLSWSPHVAQPCVYSSPEWTNPTPPRERTFSLFVATCRVLLPQGTLTTSVQGTEFFKALWEEKKIDLICLLLFNIFTNQLFKSIMKRQNPINGVRSPTTHLFWPQQKNSGSQGANKNSHFETQYNSWCKQAK